MIYPAGVPAEAVDRLAELARDMPPTIVYRGDTAAYAAAAFDRPTSNYILFSLPCHATRNARAIAASARELRAGIDYALQLAYPSAWDTVNAPIDEADFTGYADHYGRHPDHLPVLSWAWGPRQFDRNRLRTYIGDHTAQLRIGKVSETGGPTGSVCTIAIKQETIRGIEDRMHAAILAGQIDESWLGALRQQEYALRHPWLARIGALRTAYQTRPFRGFTKSLDGEIALVALRQTQARRLLHRAIGDNVMTRLLDQV